MLFTDRDFVTVDDLITIDSDVAEVSSVEGIAIEGAGGLVHQAVEECANKLLSDFQNYYYNWNVLSNFGTIAGLVGITDSTPPPRIRMGQVVVDSDTTTYWSPLKRYTVYLALRNFYQVASNRKIDDKYASKMAQVEKDLDNKYWPQLKQAGLPFCYFPVPCPGAKYELNQGVWNSANVTEVSGGSGSGNVWDVAITWSTDQAESGPSETITFSLDASHHIDVDITSLNPPVGVVLWNIYAGTQGGTLYVQATVPVGMTTYTFAGDPTLSGALVGRGQSKDCSLTFINLFNRG